MEEIEAFPRMVAADIPGQGRMYYLIDDQLDFIAEVREFLDWKMATKRAPATIKAYCFRLSWYYRFLTQKNLDIFQVTPADLTEFVIWLCNPYRDAQTIVPIHQQSPLTATSVNLILQAVGSLYHFLVRARQACLLSSGLRRYSPRKMAQRRGSPGSHPSRASDGPTYGVEA